MGNHYLPPEFRLSTAEDIAELKECTACSVLDLSHNSLDGTEVLSVLGAMENLHVLVLQGNPIVSKTKDYRWVHDLTSFTRRFRERDTISGLVPENSKGAASF